MVEPIRLHADFVGGQGFIPERLNLLGVERPRIGAATLESRRYTCIGHQIGGPMVIEVRSIIDMGTRVTANLAVLKGGGEEHALAAADAGRVVAIVGVVLRLMRVAHA